MPDSGSADSCNTGVEEMENDGGGTMLGVISAEGEGEQSVTRDESNLRHHDYEHGKSGGQVSNLSSVATFNQRGFKFQRPSSRPGTV